MVNNEDEKHSVRYGICSTVLYLSSLDEFILYWFHILVRILFTKFVQEEIKIKEVKKFKN